jgi:leucine dehydrogenase
MAVFAAADFAEHEAVVFCRDAASGLRAIVAIHSTARGPALGGCRMWPYADDDAALADVLRLSRAMTLKAAMADLPFGGGKSVVLGDARRDKTGHLLAAFGRAVDGLGGRYIVAEDVGTTVEDMEALGRVTRHAAGTVSGNPGPATAWGVFHGMRAAVRHRLKRDGLAGLTVAVQGLGSVGYALCGHLARAGARLVVADVDAAAIGRAVRDFGAAAAAPEAIFDAPAQVFAPCALGGALDADTVPRLRAVVVAGSANNQLATPEDAARLSARGILYAPDYVINAGGIINIAHERRGYDRGRAFAHVARIHDTLAALFARAEAEGVTPAEAADRIAEERIAGARRVAA